MGFIFAAVIRNAINRFRGNKKPIALLGCFKHEKLDSIVTYDFGNCRSQYIAVCKPPVVKQIINFHKNIHPLFIILIVLPARKSLFEKKIPKC